MWFRNELSSLAEVSLYFKTYQMDNKTQTSTLLLTDTNLSICLLRLAYTSVFLFKYHSTRRHHLGEPSGYDRTDLTHLILRTRFTGGIACACACARYKLSGPIISLVLVPALPSVSVKSLSLPDDPTVSMLFIGFSTHCQQQFKALDNDKKLTN